MKLTRCLTAYRSYFPHMACRNQCPPTRSPRAELADATCPLVSKVHIEAARHFETGPYFTHRPCRSSGSYRYNGTGAHWCDKPYRNGGGRRNFIRPRNAPCLCDPNNPVSGRYGGDIAVLRDRFTDIAAPHKEDICYATTNRQAAVKQMRRKSAACWYWGRQFVKLATFG